MVAGRIIDPCPMRPRPPIKRKELVCLVLDVNVEYLLFEAESRKAEI